MRRGDGGLSYLNSQCLTRFLLHEAPRSIDYFSPVSGGFLQKLMCFLQKLMCCTYILRWKNDKHGKQQSLLSKGVMPCGTRQDSGSQESHLRPETRNSQLCPATSMTPGYFHTKQKESRLNQQNFLAVQILTYDLHICYTSNLVLGYHFF